MILSKDIYSRGEGYILSVLPMIQTHDVCIVSPPPVDLEKQI